MDIIRGTWILPSDSFSNTSSPFCLLFVFICFHPPKNVRFHSKQKKRKKKGDFGPLLLFLFFFSLGLPIHGLQPWLSSGQISHLRHTAISLPTSHPWRTVVVVFISK